MRREALPPSLQEKRLWPAVQQMRQSTRRQVREDRWAHVPSKLLHLRKVQGISSSPVRVSRTHTHALYSVVLQKMLAGSYVEAGGQVYCQGCRQ